MWIQKAPLASSDHSSLCDSAGLKCSRPVKNTHMKNSLTYISPLHALMFVNSHMEIVSQLYLNVLKLKTQFIWMCMCYVRTLLCG